MFHCIAILWIVAYVKGECINGEDYARTRKGLEKVKNLEKGEEVMVINSNGSLVFSPVLLNLHPPNTDTEDAIKITTSKGASLTMTGEHLLFIASPCILAHFGAAKSAFARQIQPGDCVFSTSFKDAREAEAKKRIDIDQVIDVKNVKMTGLYGPVTREGNILVNNVAVSCYAYVPDHYVAHNLFAVFHHFPANGYKHLEAMFQEMSPKEVGDWLIDLGHKMSFKDSSGVCFRSAPVHASFFQ